MHTRIVIQTEEFNLAEEISQAQSYADDIGALVSFVGLVRGNDQPQNPLSHLHLTHMPIVTEHEISKIITQATQRWSLTYACVIHRVGELAVGAPIVLVLTASSHRHDAYLANRFIMDFLKTEAPFWKKEYYINGEQRWVDMKQSDQQHTLSWQ